LIARISIYHPKPGAEEALSDSMHRYEAAIKDALGLISTHTLRDSSKAIFMGMAL
jgi:heme-degrading monooxygenase HmoA